MLDNLKDLTLRDWFATFAPEPSQEDIQREMQRDHNANPFNEPYANKPPLRTKNEIIADLKYEHADAMMKRRERMLER